ncbi:hypothetical protein PINS_up010424 [Pythium insidiosum]|nr:hypothetical protein PINS_up010424 [Pythium insidiosum]
MHRDGRVQVFDQSSEPSTEPEHNNALWNWSRFSERNLVEIDEFRPHMALHNVYEGRSGRDGSLSAVTQDAVEDRLRGVLEECDNLRLVEALVDLDSAWAGLADDVLTYLNEECASAVVATFANDWRYPLREQLDENLFLADPSGRDRTKIEARRRLNLATAVTSLVEHSSVVVPLAMAADTRQYGGVSGRSRGVSSNSELVATASVVATALEIAMSTYHRRDAPLDSLVEGVLPRTKLFALTAEAPLSISPLALTTASGSGSSMELLQWQRRHSLLPHTRTSPAAAANSSSSSGGGARLRHLYLRGAFERWTMLEHALERIEDEQLVVQWNPQPLRPTASAPAVDAAAELAQSPCVGAYLSRLASDVARCDRRVMFQYVDAGMNVDAITEMHAELHDLRDAYCGSSLSESESE